MGSPQNKLPLPVFMVFNGNVTQCTFPLFPFNFSSLKIFMLEEITRFPCWEAEEYLYHIKQMCDNISVMKNWTKKQLPYKYTQCSERSHQCGRRKCIRGEVSGLSCSHWNIKMNNIWLKCRNIIFFQPTCANVLFRRMCTSKIMWWVLLQRHRQKYQTHKSLVFQPRQRPQCFWGTAGKQCNQVEKKKKQLTTPPIFQNWV